MLNIIFILSKYIQIYFIKKRTIYICIYVCMYKVFVHTQVDYYFFLLKCTNLICLEILIAQHLVSLNFIFFKLILYIKFF